MAIVQLVIFILSRTLTIADRLHLFWDVVLAHEQPKAAEGKNLARDDLCELVCTIFPLRQGDLCPSVKSNARNLEAPLRQAQGDIKCHLVILSVAKNLAFAFVFEGIQRFSSKVGRRSQGDLQLIVKY